MKDYLIAALQLAGIGQFVLVVASIAIPRCLQWGEGLKSLRPLLRQLFWTYAVYVLGVHLFFGIVSVMAAEELVRGSVVSTALCVLMMVWWGARIGIQFCYFDCSDIAPTVFNRLAKVGLVSLFVFLTLVYGWAVFENLK